MVLSHSPGCTLGALVPGHCQEQPDANLYWVVVKNTIVFIPKVVQKSFWHHFIPPLRPLGFTCSPSTESHLACASIFSYKAVADVYTVCAPRLQHSILTTAFQASTLNTPYLVPVQSWWCNSVTKSLLVWWM